MGKKLSQSIEAVLDHTGEVFVQVLEAGMLVNLRHVVLVSPPKEPRQTAMVYLTQNGGQTRFSIGPDTWKKLEPHLNIIRGDDGDDNRDRRE